MRILHVMADTDRRGSQVFAHRLASGMRDLSHDVTTVALVQGDQRPGLGVEILGSRQTSVALTWGLRNRMKAVDITIAHGPAAGEACARAATKHTPFVYRQIRDTRFWRRRPPRPRKVPGYMRNAVRVAALSSGARGDLIDLLGLSATQVVALPNGVPVDEFHVPTPDERAESRERLGVDPDQFIAMTVGSLIPEKAVDVAIRSVVDLADVHLVVVGDGPERVRLERLSEGLAPGKVTFAGVVPEPRRAYAGADLLVHPSVSGDSMPTVLIESGFCGLPAVATAIGSTDEIVLNGRTGLLVPPDDPDGLSSTIELMRIGRVGREQMGAAAREHCLARFEIDVVVRKWLDALTPLTTDVE